MDKDEYTQLCFKEKSFIFIVLLASLLIWFIAVQFVPNIIFYYWAFIVFVFSWIILKDIKKNKIEKSLNFYKFKD